MTGGEFSHAVRKVPVAAPAAVTYARVDLVRLDDPAVMELELIEPELFFPHVPEAAPRLARHMAGLLTR